MNLDPKEYDTETVTKVEGDFKRVGHLVDNLVYLSNGNLKIKGKKLVRFQVSDATWRKVAANAAGFDQKTGSFHNRFILER